MVYYYYGGIFADPNIGSTSYDDILLAKLLAEISIRSNIIENRVQRSKKHKWSDDQTVKLIPRTTWFTFDPMYQMASTHRDYYTKLIFPNFLACDPLKLQ